MVKIFAKHGTDQKAAIVCSREMVGPMLKALSDKYSGNWVWVDKLLPVGEILRFTDGLVYKGFHGKDKRYCSGIEILGQKETALLDESSIKDSSKVHEVFIGGDVCSGDELKKGVTIISSPGKGKCIKILGFKNGKIQYQII